MASTISSKSNGRGATTAVGHALVSVPSCGDRRAVLYRPPKGGRLGCRRCLKLLYLSECEDAFGRAILKVRKIERRVCIRPRGSSALRRSQAGPRGNSGGRTIGVLEGYGLLGPAFSAFGGLRSEKLTAQAMGGRRGSGSEAQEQASHRVRLSTHTLAASERSTRPNGRRAAAA